MTHAPDSEPEDAEVVDGLPVLAPDAGQVPLEREAPGQPAVVATRQVAALAAGGFLAGAATVAMVHRRRTKSLTRRLRAKKSSRSALGEVVASNSFLVDVHLLRRD